MTKRPIDVFLSSMEGVDSAYHSGFSAGFDKAIRRTDELLLKIQSLQEETERYRSKVMGLEADLALATSGIVEKELMRETDAIICTEVDPEMLQAAKAMIHLMDLVQTILKMHGSNFPITENLAVLNLKTAIRKAEGLE